MSKKSVVLIILIVIVTVAVFFVNSKSLGKVIFNSRDSVADYNNPFLFNSQDSDESAETIVQLQKQIDDLTNRLSVLEDYSFEFREFDDSLSSEENPPIFLGTAGMEPCKPEMILVSDTSDCPNCKILKNAPEKVDMLCVLTIKADFDDRASWGACKGGE